MMLLKPDFVLNKNFLFIDVEASGLHRGSFPIEIGWSDDALSCDSFLICPHETWTLEQWSKESESVHGIEWNDLRKYGLGVDEAIDVFERVANGKILVSDAIDYDMNWIVEMYIAANKRPKLKFISDVDIFRYYGDDEFLLGMKYFEMENFDLYPHLHRAKEDACAMACRVRRAIDDQFDKRCREYIDSNI